MGGQVDATEDMFAKLESMRAVITEVNTQFKDPVRQTRSCQLPILPIETFLPYRKRPPSSVSASLNSCHSTKQNDWSKNWPRMKLIPTTLLWISSSSPNKVRSLPPFLWQCLLTCLSVDSNCEHCRVRHNMQQKYLNEAHELYDEFFHIVQLPLLTEEVRGPQKLKEFSKMLVQPYQPDLN